MPCDHELASQRELQLARSGLLPALRLTISAVIENGNLFFLKRKGGAALGERASG